MPFNYSIVKAAALAEDGSVFLVGTGMEGAFVYDSTVFHLTSTGDLVWEWKVRDICGTGRERGLKANGSLRAS